MSPKDVEEMTKTAEKVQQALIGKLYSKDLVDRVLKLISEYRIKHKS